MSVRSALLQGFLDDVAAALEASSMDGETAAAIGRVYKALDIVRPENVVAARHLPVCDHLEGALDAARGGSAETARVADAFARLAPSLAWAPRESGGPFASADWPEGHANTMIVGRNGIEDRGDVYVGASLLAPHVRYPDHNHPPEEVYLALTPGRFQHGDSDWFEPGVGGTFYNLPGIKHAMASTASPFLAIWCLWTGKPA